LIARGKHYLIYGKKTNESPTLEGRERLLQNRVLIPNWLFLDDVSSISYDDWTKKYTNIVSLFFLHLILLSYFLFRILISIDDDDGSKICVLRVDFLQNHGLIMKFEYRGINVCWI